MQGCACRAVHATRGLAHRFTPPYSRLSYPPYPEGGHAMPEARGQHCTHRGVRAGDGCLEGEKRECSRMWHAPWGGCGA